MLLYIRFNNFFSFAGEGEWSFKVGKQPAESLYDINLKTTYDKFRLNKVTGVLGANGSGKTQFLKVLPFLSWFIARSAKRLESNDAILFSPFKGTEEKISNFEVGFLLKNEDDLYDEYRYELSVTTKKVYREALYQKTSRSFSYIFERINDEEIVSYKHRHFLSPSLADDANTNVSLIAYANLLDSPVAKKVVHFFSSFAFNVHPTGREEHSSEALIEAAELFNDNEILKNQVENLLCKFDIGISKLKFEQVVSFDLDQQAKEVLMPVAIHQYGNEELKFWFINESNGTRSAFILLGIILPILQKGGLAIIDEIDNDLHPHLLPHLIDLFKFEHTNPHQAQLIFSCHTPEVFNILQKHQIYLCRKRIKNRKHGV
jgi:AAA15 family ATPase/GTPase